MHWLPRLGEIFRIQSLLKGYFYITAAVECCLSHGLRRRALGLFRSSSTTALLHKVAKSFPPASSISKLVLEAEAMEGIKYVLTI